MALKPDRIELLTNVSFFMNTTAERGGIVGALTVGSGTVSMDNANATVGYAASSSGVRPIGLLLNDVVNLDLTRQHINWHRDEVQVGGKVTLLRVGEVVTNMIEPQVSFVAGSPVYLGPSGLLTSSQRDAQVVIGQFLTSKDADGYARVSINI